LLVAAILFHVSFVSNESTPLTAYGSRLVGWVSGWMRRQRWTTCVDYRITCMVWYDSLNTAADRLSAQYGGTRALDI